jgi:hypothetical protein
VGSLVYTRTPSGWLCARAPTPYRLRSATLIFDPWVEQLRSDGTRVSTSNGCASGRCVRLIADFRESQAFAPSTVHLEVVVDASTYLMVGYTVRRTYEDDGKQAQGSAAFEYGVSDRVSDPIPPCVGDPPARFAPLEGLSDG